MSYLPEPLAHTTNKIGVKLDFSNYATKSALKNATHLDAPDLLKKLI